MWSPLLCEEVAIGILKQQRDTYHKFTFSLLPS
jgi:hypothetical protein